jgi:hypothetical protein
VVTTGIAATAAPSGCSRSPRDPRLEARKEPPDSGGFFAFSSHADGRENPAGLLDIGGSLC